MPASGNSARQIRAAVEPDADWQTQIRQAVEAYVGHIESTTGTHAELDPRATVAGRRGATVPAPRHAAADQPAGEPERKPRVFGMPTCRRLTQAKAVILVGGLRELTALAVEDGHSVREIVEPAVQASVAMLGYRH